MKPHPQPPGLRLRFHEISHGLKFARQLSNFTPVCALGSAFRFPSFLGNNKSTPVGCFVIWSRVRESTQSMYRSVQPSRATVPRTVAFRSVRFPSFFGNNKSTPVGCFVIWSRVRESNPPSRLGKPLYYRYTNPASRRIVAQVNGKFNRFLSKLFSIPVNCILRADDFPFCPCGKLQNWQKNCFSKKMWLNFHCRCGRIYKYHYGCIAPIWTSPKR